MALIGKIREKSTLLLIVVGVGMILFIAPYDSIMSMFGNGQTQNTIGMFNGEPMYSDEWFFEPRVDQLKRQYQAQGQQLPDDYARSMVFNQMINDSLLNMELRKIGLTTTLDELDAIQTGASGVEISEYIKKLPYFQDANKQFSKDSLDKKLQFFMNNNEEGWKLVEEELSRSNIISKYVSMVAKGVIVTDYEAKKDYLQQQEKANAQYVYQTYASVPDSAIQLTDADYQAYYDEHKDDKQYEMEETRGFDFVAIDIIPSAADSAIIEGEITSLIEKFENTSPENDSLFVINNSDVPVYNGDFIAPNTLPIKYDSLVQNSPVGTVVGPFIYSGAYRIMKVVESRDEPEAKVRHILVSTQEDPSEAGKAKKKVRADSILRALNRGSKFEDLVELSDDPGKATNQGEYGPFDKDAQFVQPFKDFGLNHNVGERDVVESQFGYHVMEVLERDTARKVVAPAIEMKIIPFDETIGMYQDSAYQFIQAAKEAEDFDAYVKERGFFGVISEDNIVISQPTMNSPVLENNYQILRWAFNADLNEVSDFFYMNKSHKLVVAKLTKNIPEGTPSFETAKQIMHDEVMKEKKADYLKAQISGAKDLQAIEAKWKTGIQNATGVTFKDKNFSDVARNDEREDGIVIATLFTMEAGEVSEPIAASEGVYVVKVNELVPAEPKEDFTFDKLSLQETLRSTADSGIMIGLRDLAEIKDYRKKNELIKSE